MKLLLTKEITTPVEYFDLLLPSNEMLPTKYRLEFDSVVEDRALSAPDALITAYLGFGNPCVFHEGVSYPYYISIGQSNWEGEYNALFLPQPYSFGGQTLQLGFRMSIDTGTSKALGSTGYMDIYCAGTVSGNAVCQKYQSISYRGMIGGEAGNSPKDPNQPNGAKWFTGDPVGTPFSWPTEVSYSGHYTGAIGQIPTGFRIRANGGGSDGWKLISGLFRLYVEGQGQATEYVPEVPANIITRVGNYSALNQAFNGTTDQTAANSAFAVNQTIGYIGVEYDKAVSLSKVILYGSNNAGFVNNYNGSLTLQLWGSNSIPSSPTSGTNLKVVGETDANSKVITLLKSNADEYRFYWVTISQHSGSGQSMYVSQVQFSL